MVTDTRMDPKSPSTRANTRQAKKEALEHILSNILSLDESDPIRDALDLGGYQDPHSIVTMLDSDIALLYYVQDSSKILLSRYQCGLLMTFRDWIKFKDSIGDPIKEKWLLLDMTSYNEYRSSSFYPFRPSNTGSKTRAGPNSQKEPDPLQDFKKGIKRDATLYPVLKHMRNWDCWQRGTTATARAQDVAEVLDHWYVPPKTTKMEKLFDEK